VNEGSVVDRIRVTNNEKNMIWVIIPLPFLLKEKELQA